jgi:asparagine synthase (glutamine-hydrolysing)
VLGRLADLLPFEAPGWNHLYAAGHAEPQRFPGGVDLFFPYIRDRLYSAETLRLLKGLNPSEESDRFMKGHVYADPVSRFQYFDTMQYLPGDILAKVDRMSMANSLEVRSPLLDYTVVEYMATLPVSFKLRQGVSKYVLRRVAEKLLPAAVLAKRKQGFALPKDQWFQGELREAATEILLDPKTLSRRYFRESTIKRMLQHHATGRRDYSTWIWCLVILEMWFRVFLDEPWAVGSRIRRSAAGH